MNRRSIITIIFIIIAGVIAIGYYRSRISTNNNVEQVAAKIEYITVSQQIEGDDSANTQEVEVGTTALELLQKNAEIEKQGEGQMAFVTAINGREALNDNKEFWALYINGKQAEVGAGSYTLQDGDNIVWKVETY